MKNKQAPKVIKITIEFDNGQTLYMDDKESVALVYQIIPQEIGWKKGSSLNILRNKYFQMLAELVKAQGNGDSKADLHEALKPILFGKFKDFNHYFTTNEPEYSTKHLNREGWIALIQQLKTAALDIFSYTFKD